jgi:hypothetical protein
MLYPLANLYFIPVFFSLSLLSMNEDFLSLLESYLPHYLVTKSKANNKWLSGFNEAQQSYLYDTGVIYYFYYNFNHIIKSSKYSKIPESALKYALASFISGHT